MKPLFRTRNYSKKQAAQMFASTYFGKPRQIDKDTIKDTDSGYIFSLKRGKVEYILKEQGKHYFIYIYNTEEADDRV